MSSEAILWGISIVYFLAFGSLYIQLPSLSGDDGIAPVRLLNLDAPKSVEDFIRNIPSVVRFREYLQLDSYHATELLVFIGLIVSFLSMVTSHMRGTVSMFILWGSFISVAKVCAGVINWKWSCVLLEAGFLCILLSIKLRTRRCSPSSGLINWLLKWLLFRTFVSAGFAKLASGSYSWWDLDAAEYFFEDQLSPTPFAWYLRILPSWGLRLVSVAVIVCEIVVPYLMFVPVYGVKMFAFFVLFVVNANIILIGNFGISIILNLVLCLAAVPQNTGVPWKRINCRNAASCAITIATLGVTSYGLWIFFGFADGLQSVRIMVPRYQFVEFAKLVVIYTVYAAAFLFAVSIIGCLRQAVTAKGCVNKMIDSLNVILVGLLGCGIFMASLAPFTNLKDAGTVLPLPRFMHELTAALKPLHLANDYRFYYEGNRNILMKTPAEGRTTLVLEGAMNEHGPWKELSLNHAPGRLEKMPSMIPGHLPVVEFELGLCGEKSFENSPILAGLVYRLLTQQPHVRQLIEPSGFVAGPKYIQIKKYTYRFSQSLTEKSWWKRKLQNVYLPPVHASSPRLQKTMEAIGIVGKRRPERSSGGSNVIVTTLDQLRGMVGQPRDLTGFYVVVGVIAFMNKLLF